ncbi:tripeptide aminopeptidase [Sporobacter termitidis DSM 10068]|uniref:Peptidase T n=2 Tax=Sporobacter TaxID=44748 RepID=A0A1M5Z377_9FIRM|nr:tripeptide aminopeptidase [Sporobacter termitidis DSM 10068]
MATKSAKYPELVGRFIGYAKTETRSDEKSGATPSTQTQVAFAKALQAEMAEIGLINVHYLEKNGFVIGTLPATPGLEGKRKVGFIAHMDTADFSAVNVDPQLVESYDGASPIKLGTSGYVLDPAEFANLRNYAGQNLITTDGTTLLGADDKAGIAEIMTAAAYLAKHPEIGHGEVRVGFGPDEEIGVGADKFDVRDFNADFAFTVDGGALGDLNYETFTAAQVVVKIEGKNVHPGTAKDVMVNALQLANDFHAALPSAERPERTSGYDGFYHLTSMDGKVDAAKMTYIVRDFTDEALEKRLGVMKDAAARLSGDRIRLEIKYQYKNMSEVIKKDMSVIALAEAAMREVGVAPRIAPIRGGTDGSKLSYMGLPTPNLFAGGENMHGRFEFVSIETMEKAVDTIVKIVELNAK